MFWLKNTCNETNETKETRETNETKETRETQETRETNVTKEINKCRGQREGKVLVTPFPVKGREGIPISAELFLATNCLDVV